MRKIIWIISFIAASFVNNICNADTIAPVVNTISNMVRPQSDVPMADLMYENGKIYVVVLVLLTIFAGIIVLLIRLEKKLAKLEKK